jgi:integrase
MKIKFTQAAIKKLILPRGKAEMIWWSSDRPGFGYRLRAGGSSRYIVQYPGSRMTLGAGTSLTLAQADRLAKIALGKVAEGQDPQAQKRAARAVADVTFKAVATRYLEARASELRPSSLYSTRLYLMKYFKPLHSTRIDKVELPTVAARLSIIAREHGQVTASRARAAASSMFGWAIGEGLLTSNPVTGTNSYASTASERVLSDKELTDIWLALGDDDYGTIVKLLILTGQRRGEIGGLHRSEIDGRTITLPEARTKNARTHVFHLTDVAYGLVEERLGEDKPELLFGSGARGYSTWSEAKVALDKRLPEGTPEWNIHDVRRTVATGLAKLKVKPHEIEALLNHSSGFRSGVAGTYNRFAYEDEKREALELWSSYVMTLVAQATGGNVERLRPKGVA